MRLLQITDLHIGREGEYTGGVDVRKNFECILDLCRRSQPDHLVFSGDLCFDQGEEEIYRWIREGIEKLAIPYDIISGNHDNPTMLARCFDRTELLKGSELYFVKNIGGDPVLFLDTTTGLVSDSQLQWLSAQLKQLEGDRIIFMHHPPVLAGVPHMDRSYSLENRQDLQTILFDYPNNLTIFTGHYHVEKTVRLRNLEINITPSCYFQIDPNQEKFAVDHYRIGLREIIPENGRLSHRMIYCDDTPAPC